MTTTNPHEITIFSLSHDYLIFLDEVGDAIVHKDPAIYTDPSVYPVLTIIAVVIKKEDYQQLCVPLVDKLKVRLFNNTDICLHSREIRRKDGVFKILLDEALYTKFKTSMVNTIKQSSIQFISSSINKLKLAEKALQYEEQAKQPYDIGDIYLLNVSEVLERVCHLLGKQTGKIIFETQGKKESRRIQSLLTDLKKSGTFEYPATHYAPLDPDITFFTKKQNINGLQLADYVGYPFSRHAKDDNDRDNKLFEILKPFIYRNELGEGYGLKEWP